MVVWGWGNAFASWAEELVMPLLKLAECSNIFDVRIVVKCTSYVVKGSMSRLPRLSL